MSDIDRCSYIINAFVEGGTGAAKCGGNYGGTIKADAEAQAQGCAAVLWLLGDDKQVTEAGTMNFFVLWRPSEGEPLELATPPLDGTILPGITRDTVLQLAGSDTHKVRFHIIGTARL